MRQPGGSPHGAGQQLAPPGSWGRRSVQELGTVDRAVYEVIATVPTPSLDRVLARLSHAADHWKLWLAGAGVLAAVGGARGRRAAFAGVASIGVSSMVTNVLIKGLLPRRRPDRTGAEVPPGRWVRMPTSRSFPSGHSAAAFAFASAVGSTIPPLSAPLHLAAAAVAYSRVHTGVHYPGDAIAGALLGTVAATVVHRAVGRDREVLIDRTRLVSGRRGHVRPGRGRSGQLP
jgi:membrane-associated phospholipid phosphatase